MTSGASFTVLLVEDEPLIALTLVDILEELGHETVEAMTAREAANAFASRDDIDLLITDIGLPDLPGDQLADQLRGLRPDLPVVFATGHIGRGGAQEPVGDPPTARLPKPFQLDELNSLIDRLMQGRRPRGGQGASG
ncbi:response regulator [Alsobacter sp. SYSU M60028]|uniref:Response regulator n=1 Tax=Alsobacter ponti TaxID=2962936 RepID=A0ABT1L736_9HYPH|nr:response regulator [Alsobacter ponti]MCP8937257.1 response regulator [Alsobacter ponti]